MAAATDDGFERWMVALDHDPRPWDPTELRRLWQRRKDPEAVASWALFGRNLGARGVPPSHLLRVFDALERTEDAAEIRTLRNATLDAHALGGFDRWESHRKADAVRSVPVVRLRRALVAAFPSGAVDAEILDVLVGRLLRAAVGSGATRAVIDVSHVELDRDLWVRSLAGLSELGLPPSLSVVICSTEDPSPWVEAIQARAPGAPVRAGRWDRLLPAPEQR